ncbi:MAG TPA: hypothetical protein VHV82_17555 [Sporichthyaceae bacterium]|jgi:hypothetical protein|nr:hypothetical protein [Sporichthyaceae bacterium]
MADILKAALLDDAKRPAVIADLTALVDAEVAGKGGVSGAVIKTGYAAVKKIRPGFVPHAVGSLLPGFVDALDPLWAEHCSAGGGDFSAFLAARPDRSADALLGVTDARAKASSRESLKKLYDKLRPNAKKNVIEALPRLGKVIDKHAAS